MKFFNNLIFKFNFRYLPFEKDSAMDCRRNRSIDNPIRCFLSGDIRTNEIVIFF